jgi:hypothetical protein
MKKDEQTNKLSKTLDIIEQTLEDNGLLELLQPAMCQLLAQKCYVLHGLQEGIRDLDKNIFSCFVEYSKDQYASVTIDFDIIPLLSILDSSGIAEPSPIEMYIFPKGVPDKKEMH